MINKILEKIINPEKVITKLMLLAGSFILILNQFTLEYLLFPESAVMCLGVLDKREYKVKEKEFFVEMIKLAFIVIVVLAICYEEFSEEQLVFKGDTLYMLVY